MRALIIGDMQREFMPQGPLAVPNGDALVPLINELMRAFPLVVATKDWHPPHHISFAANHAGKQVGDVIAIDGVSQTLWPVHCVQHTEGAEFALGLDVDKIDAIFYKGTHELVDSYSAFFDRAKLHDTGLDHYLGEKGVDEIAIVGVATDYCVLDTALDAVSLGWKTTVVCDGCKPINLSPDDGKQALEKMRSEGVVISTIGEVL